MVDVRGRHSHTTSPHTLLSVASPQMTPRLRWDDPVGRAVYVELRAIWLVRGQKLHNTRLVDISLSNFGVLDKLPAELPRGVKRLRLCAHVIKQDPMPILEKLHYLVVLDLSGYEGQTMFCSAQGFPRLQELKLVGFSTDDWRIEVGAMPKLSDLTLRECNRKLPEGFLHLPSLNHLTLYRMPQISEDDNTLCMHQM